MVFASAILYRKNVPVTTGLGLSSVHGFACPALYSKRGYGHYVPVYRASCTPVAYLTRYSVSFPVLKYYFRYIEVYFRRR